MERLPLHADYATSLLELHWAAQLPAAASRLLPARDDYSHTNLLIEGEQLRSRELPDGRRAALVPATLTLQLGDAEFPLEGQTLEDGLGWLSQQLQHELTLLEHELPERPKHRPFRRSGVEPQVQAWFQLAQDQLSRVAKAHAGGEVRLWPHHFDIATLIELDPGGGESARSVNAGLSPGDRAYPEPYWYVTPWPRPEGSLPSLRIGEWHAKGFLAAVLPASKLADATSDPSQHADISRRFLEASVDACRSLLDD